MRRIMRLLVLVILLSSYCSSAAIQALCTQGALVKPSLTANRTVPLSIKIVFIGFNQSTINTTYLLWKENIPFRRVNQILTEPKDTGVVFELSYQFVFASPRFEKDLLGFLKKIQTSRKMLNPWFGSETDNVLYDANRLEDWLYEKREMYQGFPVNGYTFFIANLTQLPSVTYEQMARPWLKEPTPHYYDVEYFDLDLEYRIRNREFMTAWGGHHRFWFLDLSAGPSFNTPSDAPLQAVLAALEINISTLYGSSWLTQFLSDYIWESVWNLAVPQFTYAPIYSQKYRIAITVFDNRTKEERDQIPIRKTVRTDLIKKSYSDLVPYSDIEVTVAFQNCSDDQGLSKQLANAYKHSRDPALRYVDLRPLYKYLQTKLDYYVANVSRSEREVTVPVFAFAFSKSYLGYTYKWDVSGKTAAEETFWGLAQEDMAVLALTQASEFDRGAIVTPAQPNKGIGFSQLIIHEVGHMLGLMHPHQYGDVHDFVASAMSYFSHDYNFSRFDKDALGRIHVDKIIMQTSAKITEAKTTAATKLTNFAALSKLDRAEELLTLADREYISMEYVAAFERALEARKLAYEAATDVELYPNAVPFWAMCFLVIGLVAGYTLRKSLEKRLRIRVERTKREDIFKNL